MRCALAIASLGLLVTAGARADETSLRTPPEKRVWVRWEAPGTTGAVLYARGTTRYAPDTWTPVCTLPCARNVVAGDEYKIGGNARESLPFRLPDGATVAHVDVVDGTSKDVALGLMGTGVIASVIGVALILATPVCIGCAPSEHITGDLGGALAIGGLVAMAVGVVWAVAESGRRTTVSLGEPSRDPDHLQDEERVDP